MMNVTHRIERDTDGMPTRFCPETRCERLVAVITPDSEIYANADKTRFIVVEHRKDGEVYLRQFNRGETVYVLDFSKCFRMSDANFEAALKHENTMRIGVEELDWVPMAKVSA